MRLSNVLKGVRTGPVKVPAGLEIKGVSDDSRQVKDGYLFVAVKGYAQDGGRFIQEAITKGAVAIVSEGAFDAPEKVAKIQVGDARAAMSAIADNFYCHPSRKLKVIGITGTNGKTTITYIMEAILKAARREPGVIGTINYRRKGKVIPSKNTTPGCIELQSILAGMLSDGVEAVVTEVSSHSLDQGRVDRVLFDAAIFTNITSDHLDYHKTRANYFKAKKRIFEHLKARGVAILNADDKKVASLKGSIRNKVLTYGVKRKADYRAFDIALSMEGTQFRVKTPKGDFAVRTSLIGMHNVSNIMASVAAASALGIRIEYILEGVESIVSVPGRLETVDAGQPFKVFVDFAHTEDALYNILSLLRPMAQKRIVTVFGCGGNRDATKRPAMGKVACEFSDRVIITSDNPRFEQPEAIVGQIELGVKGRFSNYDIVVDRKEAIARALGLAAADDIVVIAGKGHEPYQIIADKIMPFDDREVASELLKAKV